MRRKLAYLVALAVLVCSYLVAWRFVSREVGSSEEQIFQLLKRGERALERRDLAEAMSCISHNYSDVNGLTYAAIRVRAAQALQSSPELKVSGALRHVRADEAAAEVNYYISVRSGGEDLFSGQLSLELAKEPTWRYVIFRTREWKITSAEGYPSMLE